MGPRRRAVIPFALLGTLMVTVGAWSLHGSPARRARTAFAVDADEWRRWTGLSGRGFRQSRDILTVIGAPLATRPWGGQLR